MSFSDKRHAAFSFVILLSVIFLGFYFKDTFLAQLKNIDYHWFIAGLSVFLLNYILRAYRILAVVKHNKIRYFNALSTVSIHGFLTYILPFKTGEISLPFLLNKQGVSIATSVQSLIKCRLLDLSCLGFLLFASLLTSNSSMAGEIKVLFLMLSILLLLSPYLFRKLTKIIPEKIKNWADKHKINIRGTFHYNKTEWVLSLGVWVAIAMCLYCVVRSLNMPLTISDTMCLVAIQLPLQLIPVQGIANTGNHEASWLAGLALFGISSTQSLSFALSSHVLLSVYVIVLGLFASILIFLVPRKKNKLGLN